MEQQHRLCYISRNYYNLTAAGNKAKADNEDTLAEMGAVNLGLQRSVRNSKILAFFIDLAGIIRACLLLKRGRYPVLAISCQEILYVLVQNRKNERSQDYLAHP